MGKIRSQPAPVPARPLTFVRVPDGKPPVKLVGQVTKESLLLWGMRTREAYKRKGLWLMREGLVYLLNMYFIDSNDHPKAFKIAKTILMGMQEKPD